jgi:hypothetical protein
LFHFITLTYVRFAALRRFSLDGVLRVTLCGIDHVGTFKACAISDVVQFSKTSFQNAHE